MTDEVEIDDELARFNDNLERIGDQLETFNNIFEHYLKHVLEVRIPNDLRPVRENPPH